MLSVLPSGSVNEAKPRSVTTWSSFVEDGCAVRHIGAQAQLRNRHARQLKADEYRGNGVGKDQHAVLSDLGVGDALHPAQHGVEEHDGHPDHDAGFEFHFQKATKRHAHTLHLADHVGDRGHNETQDGDHSGRFRIEAVADELGHGELAELPQIRRQQQRQQHIASGPTHEIRRGVVAQEGDQACH